MATKKINDSILTNIAEAIREKGGSADALKPSEMADAIMDIEAEPVIESKNISANGTYNAPSGVDGFSPVVVDVPNSYSASDEGKVVDNGSLVAQTSRTIDENGTYDTTTNNEVVVDVEGGGGEGAKNILGGTEEPSASLGSDGDIYLQYIHVPSGVTPLEYIQSTGTQYIDTDVLATSDVAVEVEFFDYVFSNDSLLFGYRPNSWNGGLGVNNNGNSKMYLYFGGSNNGGIIPPMESGIVKLENGKRTINGYEASFTPTTFSYSYQIFIFATNNNGTASYFSKYKIKSLKIWEDGTLIRHFIPAKDTNDVACLYDLINDDFYYNDGTGSFSYGNEINDDYIINSYCKVNGSWQSLEGTDIDDVNTEGGGGVVKLIDIFGSPQSNTGDNYEITSDRGVYSDAYQYNAFNSSSGVWGSGTMSVPAWLRYDFTDGKKRIIKVIDFATLVSAYSGGFSASAFQLQGSNDGFTTYDVLLDYTGGAIYNNTCVYLDNDKAYSSFRFYITGIFNAWYPALNRIKAYGYMEGQGGGGDAILKTVKIWTHSTGGQDASLYAQEFTWDGESLTAVGSPMDISFWSFYNHEIEYLDLFDAVRLSYTSPNWAISAITDVVYNGNAISAGNQIAYWHYSTNSAYFIICDVEGGGGEAEPIDLSYLPNSDADNVLASSDYTMLDGLKLGAFDVFVYPSLYNLTSTPFELTVDANGLYLQYGVKVGKWLSDANTDVTMYFVGKRTTNTRYFSFVGIPYALTNGNAPNFYNNQYSYAVETTIFGSNASTVYSSDTEHIYAISLDASTKTAKWYIDGNLLRTYNYGNSGNIALIGGGVPTTLDYDSDIYFKYGGVVEECESDATIIANMQAIATKLGLTI